MLISVSYLIRCWRFTLSDSQTLKIAAWSDGLTPSLPSSESNQFSHEYQMAVRYQLQAELVLSNTRVHFCLLFLLLVLLL